jgi:hypothetical protein
MTAQPAPVLSQRAWLLLRVAHRHAAFTAILNLASQQQWSPQWEINRIDAMNTAASQGLPQFPAPANGFDLFVAVKAASGADLKAAFVAIETAVNPTRAEAYVLSSSNHLNWP